MSNPTSKLEPFRDFIAAERRKKTTYRSIVKLLADKGVTADISTIHSFVKVRSKPPRKVITMREPSEPAVTAPARISGAAADAQLSHAALSADQERSGQLDAIHRLKRSASGKRRNGNALPSFREGAALERLSDDEARRLRKKL